MSPSSDGWVSGTELISVVGVLQEGTKPHAAWRAFLIAHATVTRELDRDLRESMGMGIATYDALLQLYEAGGALRMADLADRLLLSRSATSRFADRLESEGLVQRVAVSEDRRGLNLVLTDHGEARLREAAPIHLRGIRQLFTSMFDGDELGALESMMRRLASDFD